ncbi:3-hydroxyacyl-CoA dehydrogenase [Wenzhouxiangella sp. XN79A]|uniref:3-hydroxyacyl-CoA dehydrogenase NAD-binding domain-containing protein n=1 Tax=Wenzhouxiangella sp. XN79A TaxID=2724193 RepID=UPI00144A9129|nr:3-hydroxyacyl-CoA dehydrogenase NAD-binding domain-containing protein [Wenzhouxiangella sp. XN79A]NKI34472.1 3-hydroxyacyl-CoA dehydrogenase [Wenzhouxiangella sp. XN79A]
MVTEAAQTPLPGPFKHWRLETDLEGILWLYIDREGEKVNSLSREVLTELGQIVDHLEKHAPTGLVLTSGKPGTFIVGADVREFDQTRDVSVLQEGVREVHALFDRIEKLRFPKVVAFEGFCLGGGLELSLCFDWRIALDHDRTRIGFPEVNLGIYPGYGGSGRSLAAIGGMKGMEIMLTGRMLRARAARGIGLVDQTVSVHGSLRWAARRAVLKKRKHKLSGIVNKLSLTGPGRKLLAGQMRKQTHRKARPEHYPAPYRLIDEFEAHGNSQSAMIRAEAENIPELLVGDTSTNLRRVFRLMEQLKAQGKRSDFKARRVHVIGAGVMGGDIAAWCALRGLDVTLQDREMKYIEPALKRAASLFRKKLRKPAAVAAAKARLRADIEGEGVRRADVVIEAIFENRDAKRQLFENLKADLQPHTLVATNTSAIPLGELSDVFDDPGRLIGLHFFNPVARMPLVEVVHDTDTHPDRVDDGCSFATQIGKYALPATSTPGFLVNRVLVPYMYKAMTMHRDGIPKEALDKAAVRFGMPMGPVELVDTVGLDVGLGVIDTLLGDAAGEDRKVLESMVESGKKGKKTGEGFYKWDKGKPVRDDDAHKGHDLDRIAKDLIQPYLDECLACLRDDVVEDKDLLDAGMIFGTGFAPFRGGPVHYIENTDAEASADDSLLDAARAKSGGKQDGDAPKKKAIKKKSASRKKTAKKKKKAARKTAADKASTGRTSTDKKSSEAKSNGDPSADRAD